MHLDNLSLLCIDFALHPSYRPERTEQCMKDRVYCLYRVSTGKQVDYDDITSEEKARKTGAGVVKWKVWNTST